MSNSDWGQAPQGSPGPQWGQPGQPGQWGQPQQPGPYSYGHAGVWGGPTQGPPTNSRRAPLLITIGAVVVAGAVVLTLFLTGVFGDDSDVGSPSSAVKTVLAAAKDQDTDGVKANLCQKDLADYTGNVRGISAAGLQSYTVGSTSNQDSTHATVKVTVTSRTSGSESADIPVVKEGGDWKVCFSDLQSGGSSSDDSGNGNSTGSSAEPSYGNGGGGRLPTLPTPGGTLTFPNGSTTVLPTLPIPSYTP